MPVIDYSTGSKIEMDGAVIETVVQSGKKLMRLSVPAGFDWVKTIKPNLPENPASCPHTHCGFLETGMMCVKYDDGSEETIEAGQSYVIPPGHIPMYPAPAVAIEFSEDTAKVVEQLEKAVNKS